MAEAPKGSKPDEPHEPDPRVALRAPAFAASYPKDPELDRLVAAFARGNHRAVREEAEALAKRTEDPAVAKAARDLRARIEPDRIAYVLFGSTLLLLITLLAWSIHRSKELRSAPVRMPAKTVQTISK